MNGEAVFLVLFIFIGIALFLIFNPHGVAQPGHDLHLRFRELGTLKGKTKAEIIEAVGQPSSISVTGEGRLLLQWQATGCHMVLLFEGDVCLGITHEYLANS